jgi:trans-2-enoyl-CoA reductase
VNSDKAEDCRTMIDYLLGLVQEGKLKYEYVSLTVAGT